MVARTFPALTAIQYPKRNHLVGHSLVQNPTNVNPTHLSLLRPNHPTFRRIPTYNKGSNLAQYDAPHSNRIRIFIMFV
jgi:hypothetical protein